MSFLWKSIMSFFKTLIIPTLDALIYFKTEMEKQEIWLFYFASQIYEKLDIWIRGKQEIPCWKIGETYKVSEGQRPLFIKKTEVGFLVWSPPTFFNLDIFPRNRVKPCFLSALYVDENGLEFDMELDPQYYVSGNELFSSEFVKWWIKTRYGDLWNGYSPKTPYKILLMDTRLKVIELEPNEVIVIKSEIKGKEPYEKFSYNSKNIQTFEQ